MEDVRRCKKGGSRGLSWISAKKLRPTWSPPGGVVGATGCAGVGVWGNSGGRFLPVETAVGHKTVAGANFRGRGACTLYEPKVILSAKTLDPHYGS